MNMHSQQVVRVTETCQAAYVAKHFCNPEKETRAVSLHKTSSINADA